MPMTLDEKRPTPRLTAVFGERSGLGENSRLFRQPMNIRATAHKSEFSRAGIEGCRQNMSGRWTQYAPWVRNCGQLVRIQASRGRPEYDSNFS